MSNVKVRSLISTAELSTGSLKIRLTMSASVVRGSGVTSRMSNVGAVVSITQLTRASLGKSLPESSTIPLSVANNVSSYAPSATVTLETSSVHVAPPPPVDKPTNETGCPSRVSTKSLISTPVTGSLRLTVTTPAVVFLGVATPAKLADGATIFVCQLTESTWIPFP